jgi:hypothetical protein
VPSSPEKFSTSLKASKSKSSRKRIQSSKSRAYFFHFSSLRTSNKSFLSLNRLQSTSRLVPQFSVEDDDEEDEESTEEDEEDYYEEIVSDPLFLLDLGSVPIALSLVQKEVDENDQAALDSFAPARGESRNLADIIMAKIEEHERGGPQPGDELCFSFHRQVSENISPDQRNDTASMFDPKVVEVYTK